MPERVRTMVAFRWDLNPTAVSTHGCRAILLVEDGRPASPDRTDIGILKCWGPGCWHRFLRAYWRFLSILDVAG
ncbi:MAG: hypothetical protein OXM02_00095 [Bacteroidota bacterium]|nr:hypothetical protein [Bacteroidota bacterium]MDE2956121.1 hypothetical protein [Bacteroidota bacterium]